MIVRALHLFSGGAAFIYCYPQQRQQQDGGMLLPDCSLLFN